MLPINIHLFLAFSILENISFLIFLTTTEDTIICGVIWNFHLSWLELKMAVLMGLFIKKDFIALQPFIQIKMAK